MTNTAPNSIFTTSASNQFYWQILEVAADSEQTARSAFDAYLASESEQKGETEEFEMAQEMGDADRADYAYSYKDVEIVDNEVANNATPTVRMIESGGNG